MAYKNKVSLKICGRTMTLAGNESIEYITKVANYIDEKAAELRKSPQSKNLSPQMISVLTSINIADEYFKQIEINEKMKSALPDGFDVTKPEKEALFTQELIDDYKIEIERLRNELRTSKQKQAELESKLAVAENKAVLFEEDNKRKRAEIERLRQFEELFESEKEYEAAKEEIVEEKAAEEMIIPETNEEKLPKENDEVFENQMDMTELISEEAEEEENEEEMEFPLQEEPIKAQKVKYDSHKLYNSSNNYYRQI